MIATNQFSPASKLAVDWYARRERLLAQVWRNPADRRSWHWQLQIKILTFLLNRYGDDPMLDWKANEPTFPAISLGLSAFQSLRHPPKPIRLLLEDIAAANGHARN